MDTVTLIPGSEIKAHKFKIAGGLAAVGLGCALLVGLNSGNQQETNPLNFQSRLDGQRVAKTIAKKFANSNQKARLVRNWNFRKAESAKRNSRTSEPFIIGRDSIAPEPYIIGRDSIAPEPYAAYYDADNIFHRAENLYEDHQDDEFFSFMDELDQTTAFLQKLDKDTLISTLIFGGLEAAMLEDQVADLGKKLARSKDAVLECENGKNYNTQNNFDDEVEAICVCDNGVPNRKTSCNQDRDMVSCASCAPGYSLKFDYESFDYYCQWNACYCSNGEEAPLEQCLNDGDEVCASCYPGFEMGPNNDCSTCARGYTMNYWGDCVRDTYSNSRDVAYAGFRNVRSGDDDDDDKPDCPSGYHPDSFLFLGNYCAENKCYCEHGEATSGRSCPWHGNHECKPNSCDWGYEYGWLFGECSPISWD